MAFESRQEFLKEYTRAFKDTSYALRTYLETYDNTQSKYVPLVLFPDQETLIKDYDTANENIVIKYRQAGVSTVTAAWAAKKLAFATKKKPEKILIVANKLDTATEFAIKIRSFLTQWPDWLDVDFSKEKDATSHYKLTNGCEVKAVGTSKDALRGYTPTILIFDEAAYIEAGDDFWAACMASLSTGGKVIVVSTPNGFDPIYYGVYKQAIDGINDFKVSYLFWYTDPRFTKDLKWIKCEDIVHYMLNREQYKDEDITIEEFDRAKFIDLLQQGYKPYSTWFEAMCKKLKYDARKINQEINCAFLGSGDNVFDPELVEKVKEKHVCDPKKKHLSGQLWQWEEPIPGHKYIMGVDVSRGDSEDYSAINIIDFDERKQVMEYLGKMPPDELAYIAFEWGSRYNAFIVVDITGGMGIATSRKLQELGYKNLYIDGMVQNNWKYDPKIYEKIPGINFNSKRTQIIAALEEQLRHDFVVRSIRTVNEFNTFVYINGKADHMKGQHDDCIMSLAMPIYVGDIAFTQLQKVDDTARAMINSWTVNENKPSTGIPSGHPHNPNSFNPFQLSPSSLMEQSQQPTKQQYSEYAWLFGKPKR
jgi:hypothetical protein